MSDDPKTTPPPAPETPPSSPGESTVNELLTIGTRTADAADVQRVHAYLRPFIERAEHNLPLYRALAEETKDLHRRAAAIDVGRLSHLGCPMSLLEELGRAAGPVLDIPGAVTTVERVIAAIGRLSPQQCRLTDGMEITGKWPAIVTYYRDALYMVGEGEDIHRLRIAALGEVLPRVETWGKNYAAGRIPHPLSVRQRPAADFEPRPTVTEFDPIRYRPE